MAANINLHVNLDAVKSIEQASKLYTIVQATVNSAPITVGNPAQIKASADQATVLNDVIKQIAISTQRLNISLAKTAKLMVQANPSQIANSDQITAQFDNIIAGSQKSIQQLQQMVVPAVQAIQKPAEAAGQAVEQTGQAAQNQTKKFSSLLKLLGKGARENYSNFSAIANSFFSPITLAIIAFEAAVKTFTYLWNNLTQSIQKMTTRGQAAIKAIQRKHKAIEQETKASSDLVKQLEELNKEQNLSIDQQRLAQSIIARLNKQYKDLGITLDETTGKYKGLYEAQRKIDQRNKQSQANALKQEISAQREIVNAALANAFGRGINLDDIVKGSDFFNLAEKIGGTLGAENADILAKKWNTHDLQKQLEVIDQLIQGLSSSDSVLKNGPEAREALATLIDYRKQLEELNSVDTQIIDANKRLADSFKQQTDALKQTKEQIEDLTKDYEAQQRANSLAQLDPEDRVNAIRAEVEALEKRNEVIQKAQEYGKDKTNDSAINSQTNKNLLQRSQKMLKSSEDAVKATQQKMEKNREIIASLFDKIKKWQSDQTQVGDNFYVNQQSAAKAQQYLKQLNQKVAENKQLQQDLVQKQNRLNEIKKTTEELEVDYQKSQTVTLEHEQALANLEKERQENLNAIQEKTKQIADLEKEIQEARRKAEEEAEAAAQAEADRLLKQQETIDNINKSYQKQLEAYNKTPLQQQIEDALQGAEKAKGTDLTREEIDNIVFYVTQLQKMKQLEEERQKIAEQQKAIEELFASYQEKQTLDYMKMVGQQKEAVLLEAKLNAEKAKGAKLTDAEVASLKQYLEVDDLISQFKENQKVELDKPEVITNDLARKGGWASSVVVDRSVDINEQILKVEQSQKDILTNIKDLVDKYSVIQ